MKISRRLARPLLSGVFVDAGLDQLRHPETRVKAAEAVAVPVARRVSVLPQDTESLVRLNGAVQVGAAVLLAIGKLRRLAALALICTVIPTTVAEHRFWEETDEQMKKHQRTQFLKNLALLGGLILAAVDTEGAPSLEWRARRQARMTGRAVVEGRGRAVRQARKAATAAAILTQVGDSKTAFRANRAAARSVAKAQQVAARAQQVRPRTSPGRAVETARKFDFRGAQGRALARAQQVDLRGAQKRAAETAHKVSSTARQGTDVANQVLRSGAGQASELLSRAAEHLPVNVGQD